MLIGRYANSVTAGNGDDTVSGAQGSTSVTLGDGADTVSLAGYSNIIRLGNGEDTIAAGAGDDEVISGDGNDTITLRGWSHNVALGAGTDTVNGGSGDTITLSSTSLLLKGGMQEAVFLNAGNMSVDDLANDTTIVAGAKFGSADILDFAKDPGFVLNLTDAVGGYATASSVVTALTSDGHGGTQLLLGSSPGASVIDFVNTQSDSLTSAHFRIG